MLCYIQTSKRIIDSLKDFSTNNLPTSLIFFGTSIRGSLIKYVDCVVHGNRNVGCQNIGLHFKNQEI